MSDMIKGIIYSISYFTILPIKIPHFEANKNFYKGVVYGLPIAGLLLGLVIVGSFLILPFEPLYKAILVSIAYLFLYGFIHLEAVADTIDGLFASLSGKNVHTIMKEPQIGAIGAIGTFCFVLLKILAIAYLLFYEQFSFVILIFMLSRVSLLFALDLEFHKDSSFVLSLKNSYSASSFFKILFFPFNILTKYILSKLKKQLGFLNGDTLGFNIELQEIILLNIAVMFC